MVASGELPNRRESTVCLIDVYIGVHYQKLRMPTRFLLDTRLPDNILDNFLHRRRQSAGVWQPSELISAEETPTLQWGNCFLEQVSGLGGVITAEEMHALEGQECGL